ncbi:MAG TPA: CDP-alcohol phosphatidyltransferase family protein [Candidatus Binataceae bacterium]|nr:CDP-alcohol phosphatidyltransferase family protein [Candidatus Binataceae bacterium]
MTRERYLTICAWGVHLFTAAGAVAGLLALDRIAANDFRAAFIWMAVAIIIDSADGTLARMVNVRERIPLFDGALLDNIVDYLNYVAVPLLLMLRAGTLPRNAAGFFAASLAMLASAYGFSRADAKTEDHYFRGFPSYWNLVALYLFCLGYAPLVNMLVTVVLALMVFVPVKYIYPSRTEPMRPVTLVLAALWAPATLALIPALPTPNPILLYTSLAFVVYYFLMSFLLHLQPHRRAARRSSS